MVSPKKPSTFVGDGCTERNFVVFIVALIKIYSLPRLFIYQGKLLVWCYMELCRFVGFIPLNMNIFLRCMKMATPGPGTYAMPEPTNAQVYIVVVAVVVFLLLFIEVRDCALCFPLICCCCGAHSQFTTQINMAKKWQWQKQSKWQVGNTGRGLLPPDSYVKII